ncbi:hypothetical protein KCU77_g4826, partial [Aureobasidium melanogenum]
MYQLSEDKRKVPDRSEFGKLDWRRQLISLTNKNKAQNRRGNSAQEIKTRIALSTQKRISYGPPKMRVKWTRSIYHPLQPIL